MILEVNSDAWSHGQIHSKLWLIEELEKISAVKKSPVIWILGGWYSVLPFLIFSRDRLRPDRICSFDIDEKTKQTAEKINDAWRAVYPHKFFHYTADATALDYNNEELYGPKPDIVINTACEHFSNDWLRCVPEKTLIIAQSTDMEHPEHTHGVKSLAEFKQKLTPHLTLTFEGQKNFNYNPFIFNRYMLIGQKI